MECSTTNIFKLGFQHEQIRHKFIIKTENTRRPASADRTACRQFQTTGQPVSRTQASDAMMSRLLRYEAKCVQHRCFQWGSVPLRSDIKETVLPPANILIPLERQLTALQLCRWQLLHNETLQQTFHSSCIVVLTQYQRVTDGRTDGQTDGIAISSTAIASIVARVL